MLHRHAKPAVAGSFVVGSLLGALTTAFGLVLVSGLLSPIPVRIRAVVAICSLAILALHHASILCLDLPQRAWQIPQQVFHQSPNRAAARFAFELGTGVRTYITTAAPYGLAIVLALTPGIGLADVLLGALLAAIGYGLGRSVVVASQVVGHAVAVDHPRIWLQVAAWLSLAAALSVAVQVLSAS